MKKISSFFILKSILVWSISLMNKAASHVIREAAAERKGHSKIRRHSL